MDRAYGEMFGVFWQMGNEVIRYSAVDRDYGECVFSISVLPSGSWLIGAAAVGTNLGGQRQVPYMAWTRDHGSFHHSQHLLYHRVGRCRQHI